MIADILQDGMFAAIAAIGFGSISNTPFKTLKHCGWIAAFGHAARLIMMRQGIHIVVASFGAALLIGVLARLCQDKKKMAFEPLAFVALLPMIPGMYAYGTVQALIRYMEHHGDDMQYEYLSLMTYNAATTFLTILAMAIGVMIARDKK